MGKQIINKQITVIGNASIDAKNHQLIQLSQDVGRIIAKRHNNLICGGLSGVMLEVCRGFKSIHSSGRTIGILPDYNFNANEFIDIIIPTGLDVGRNQIVVASGFVIIAIGGGAGTLSEIAIASQINKPIILMKGSGGWADKLTGDYLDKRKNSPLYHVNNLDDLTILLDKINTSPSNSGCINNGHNR